MFEAAWPRRRTPGRSEGSRHKGSPLFRGLYRATFCVCALLSLVLVLPGCAAKRNYWGYPATDLSPLRPGTTRPEVDALLGPPDSHAASDGVKEARYLYDRGFVGTLEETSVGEKVFWAPVMAWGELVSLGLVELMIHCQAPCQKGLLEVRYDHEDHLLQATEHLPPDTHPAVKGCMTRAVGTDLAVCQAVRERRRPSTLPGQAVSSP